MDSPPEPEPGAQAADDAQGLHRGHVDHHVQLYKEDVVQSLSNPARIGLVTRVGGGDSSESDSSSDSASEGEELESDGDEYRTQLLLAEGCARIAWIDSPESVEKVTDVRVVDRAFLHGDVVALASDDPLGQTGTVIDVDMSVELELDSNKEIVRGIDSKQLCRVCALAPGDNVIGEGTWVGQVEGVLDSHVTVVFENGSKCKVQHAKASCLVPCDERLMYDTESPYYPGQRVRPTSSRSRKNANCLRGTWKQWKANQMKGTVVDVEAGTVIVDWIAGLDMDIFAVPSEKQDARDLVPMTYFTHTKWQIGDHALLPQCFEVPVGEVGGMSDVESSKAGAIDVRNVDSSLLEGSIENVGESVVGLVDVVDGATECQMIEQIRKVSRNETIVEKAAVVVNTRTSVDILWQDGNKSYKINSCSLVPAEHLGDHDFQPEQYVLDG